MLANPLHQSSFGNTSTTHPFLLEWGNSGLTKPGLFSFPQNLAIDNSGNVYVTDLGNMRVQKFNNDGTFLHAWGSSGSGSGQFNAPTGIAVYEAYVFVVDTQLHNVQKFNLNGTFITKWGGEGQGSGQFLLPNGIAVGNNGTVYVVDTGNQRIQKFTSDGLFISEFGESGIEEDKFLLPSGIAIDKFENSYVSDPGKNKILRFDSNGIFSKSYGPNAAGFSIMPQGLAIDPLGHIYVADTGHDRILKLDQDGTTLTTWGSTGITAGQFKMPKDIALDQSGHLFVVDSNGHRIQKFGSPLVTDTLGSQYESTTSESQQTQQETQLLPLVNPVPGDLTKPVIIPPNDLFIEATGGLTPVSVGQAMATDESGIQSLSSNAPAQFPLGTTTIIWTAIDGAGNMGIATQIVTVVDTIPPIISTIPDILIEAQNVATNFVDLESPTASDAVGVISITNDAPDVFPLGETLVTWTAVDVAGNSATTNQIVTVVDTTSPTIFIPEDIVFEATSFDENEIYIGEAAVFDNGEVISITNDSPQFFALGNTTVSWIAADAAGNIASEQQLVTVVDTTSPALTAPRDIVSEAISENDNLVELGNPTVIDVQNVTTTNDAPLVYQVGETIVTWVAVDPDGNFAVASQNVTIVDTTPPILIVPDDITIEATGVENNVVALGNLTAEDVTGIYSISHNAPDTFPFGTTIVTWSATDNYGNSVSDEQTITVIDTTAPQIIAPDDIVVEAIDISQNFVDLGQPYTYDIIAVESVANNAPNSYPIGVTTIMWNATDTSGNTAYDDQVVTVRDTTLPTITPPTNIVAEAISSSGTPIKLGQATATDVIGVDSITNNAPDLFYLGETTVVWTATDTHGNTAMANQTITVIDTTAPSIVPPLDVVFEAQDYVSNVVVIGVANADDIVGIISVQNDAPDVFSLGDTLVTWTATDAAGNFVSATQKVSVMDTIPPSITAPESVQVEATSALETVVTLGDATASDVIGIESITNDAPAIFPVGEIIVTWTATDLGGLSSTDTQIVTVVDTTPPTISVPDIITVEATSLNQNVVDFGTIIADDLVGVASVTNDAPDVFPFGLTTITWTIVDEAGNVATATQMISIIDTTAPSIIPPDDVVIEATSEAYNIVNLGSAQPFDAVSVASITNDYQEGFPVGETIVTWTAVDSSGNSANATQIVTVIDSSPPTIITPDEIVVEATSSTNNTISLVSPTAEDSVSEVTITNNWPGAFPLGETIITWTATDEAGNSATATQKITVVDTTPPELIMPEDVVIDATSLQTPVIFGEGMASDLTDPSPTITNDAPFSFPLGETIITWTAVDKFGNSISNSQTITVQACGKPPSYYNMIIGSPEDDILFGTNLADLIFAQEGDDIVIGAKGNDCIFGEDGDDILFGNEGNDNISGGGGNDVIRGQSGEDVISGDSGLDLIDGGDDKDSCNLGEETDGDLQIKCES